MEFNSKMLVQNISLRSAPAFINKLKNQMSFKKLPAKNNQNKFVQIVSQSGRSFGTAIELDCHQTKECKQKHKSL